MSVGPLLFRRARVFDGVTDWLRDCEVLVEAGVIREVSDTPIVSPSATVIDLAGRTLMPGLIDLHIHAYASSMSTQAIERAGEPYRTAHAIKMLGHALDCGFTTVRDIGGGDYSLWRAIDDGLVQAPRFFYAGRALSMTGGHGDFRSADQSDHGYCSCGRSNSLCAIADGIDECLKAAREELRRGAHCIKIMGSGGVASPTDPLWMNQYREDEIRAIVQECVERRTYVAAHCHPASAIRRAVECGVRCIEHGTLIDSATAALVAERGAYIVPTLAIGVAMTELGAELGLSADSQEKSDAANRGEMIGLQHMRDAGVKVGFGTDLLGASYVHQCREFTLRREVFSSIEILRQATSVGAEILMQAGKLGCIAAGAHADLIVVNGDPLTDIGLLAQDGARLNLIMRNGEIVKNQL